MKVVYVTSDVTYVKDNYLSLLSSVTDPKNVPSDVEVVSVILLKIPFKLLIKNIVGLGIIGAPFFGFTLLKNMISAHLNDPRVKLLEKRGIPYYRCKSVNQKSSLEYLKSVSPDLIVNARTRNIYKKPVLDLPTIGCINIHHGLLPDNRGTLCDLWAWVEKRLVGFSVHWMNEKIDDGDIIDRRKVDVKGCKSYVEIPFRSSKIESGCLLDCMAKIAAEGRISGLENRTQALNYTRTPTPSQIADIRRRGYRL